MKEWNPRYVAYAASNGLTPEAQMEHDTEEFPGGKMAGFILWMSRKWQEWRKANGRKWWDPTSDEDQAAFDASIGVD